MMQPVSDLISRLQSARHVMVLTGAGASAESGIPTFRDTLTGLWERFDAAQLATPEAFDADPDLVWGWYEWRRGLVMRCQPNAGHTALVRMQERVPRFTLVTQNVDDLHERAGSRDVVHLHGSLLQPRCQDCGFAHALAVAMPDEPEGGRRLPPPACRECGGRIRPGVVWFGESLPQESWILAQNAAADCDAFLSVGTSAAVYPAAGLVDDARAAGACTVQINPDVTGAEGAVDYVIQGTAATVLPELVQAVWPV